MVYWYNTLLYVLIFTAHNLILLSCYLCVFFCVLLKKLRFNKYIFEQPWHNIIFYMHFSIVGTFKIISFFATKNSPVYQTTLWESWVGWKELSQRIHLYVLLSWALIYNSLSHWVSFICCWIHYSTTIGISICVWYGFLASFSLFELMWNRELI